MTKSIASYPQSEKRVVISRRLERKTGGLGYWAALDAQKRQGQVKKVEVVESVVEDLHLTKEADLTLDSE
jgi:hypothetical protein